ncbi:MAG: hypothetical protein Q9174_007454 [Haloplaca sp. 1 TL-2023]
MEDHKLLQMMDTRNQGLKHIREVILYDSMENKTDWNELPLSCLEAATLVNLLPRNILTSFQWRSWERMPARIYQTLYRHQKCLKHVELNSSEMWIDELFKLGNTTHDLLDGLEQVQSLRIMPTNEEPLGLTAQRFFRNHIGTVRTLSLNFGGMVPTRRSRGADDADEGTYGIELAFKAIFCPGDVAITSFLTRLELTFIDLGGDNTNVLPALNLPQLKELEMYRCDGLDEFLGALAQVDGGLPKLTKLCIYYGEEFNSQSIKDGRVNAVETQY